MFYVERDGVLWVVAGDPDGPNSGRTDRAEAEGIALGLNHMRGKMAAIDAAGGNEAYQLQRDEAAMERGQGGLGSPETHQLEPRDNYPQPASQISAAPWSEPWPTEEL